MTQKKDPDAIKHAAALKRLGRAREKLAIAASSESQKTWQKIVEILEVQLATPSDEQR